MSNLYSPLDTSAREIRILDIIPSTDPAALVKCKLHVTSLDIDPPLDYMALSYVWGNPDDTTQIEINGFHRQVTTNLESALRHIRKPDEEVRLWVDAVCINQEDLEERGSQVSMMGSVYSMAKKVIAWLGEETEDTPLAFQFMEQCAEWVSSCSSGELKVAEIKKRVPLISNPRIIEAIKSITYRTYWTRTWILQELVLAREVVVLCGTLRLQFSTFRLAESVWIDIWRHYYNNDPSSVFASPSLVRGRPLTHMLKGVQIFSTDPGKDIDEGSPGPALSLKLLLDLEGLEATDPRDKIYGLFGILPSLAQIFPTPDYTRTVEDLFCQVAKELILSSGSLSIAHYVTTKDSNTISKLPSWVPRWGTVQRDLDDTLSEFVSWYSRSSAAVFKNYIRVTGDNRTLFCKGKILDQIDEVYPITIAHSSDLVINVGDMVKRVISTPATGNISSLEALYRVLCADILEDHQILPDSALDYRKAAYFIKALSAWIQRDTNSPISVSTDELFTVFVEATLARDQSTEELVKMMREVVRDTDLPYYEQLVTLMLEDRCPFRTTGGKMGIGISEVAPGDVICHLVGHNFPFVLHREADHYLMRGECYVSGIELPDLTEDVVADMHDIEIR